MSEKETGRGSIHWDIQDTHPQLVAILREKLSEVTDPEIGLSIIQLGLIRQVQVKEDVARIHMLLTTPFCPYGPALIEATRAKALEALGMPVEVELGMEPWDFSMLEDPDAFDWGLCA